MIYTPGSKMASDGGVTEIVKLNRGVDSRKLLNNLVAKAEHPRENMFSFSGSFSYKSTAVAAGASSNAGRGSNADSYKTAGESSDPITPEDNTKTDEDTLGSQ